MKNDLEQMIAFYLTGRRQGEGLGPLDPTYRPALLARYSDLTSLRYDFPVVLNTEGPPERCVLSLSGLVDEAVEWLSDVTDAARVARHAYRIEREIRQELAKRGSADFVSLWNEASDRLKSEDASIADSARLLWNEFQASGEIVDVSREAPAKMISHAWASVNAEKALAFKHKAERLLLKLHDILTAESTATEAGRTPERLSASVGAAFAGTFDFSALSGILGDAKPGFALSDARRTRIRGLIDTLESQRFYPLLYNVSDGYAFTYTRISDAVNAFVERQSEAAELSRTLAVAELEAKGEYREAVHDAIFDSTYGSKLQNSDLPDYLVCTNVDELTAGEALHLTDALAAGLPFKILVQTDDVVETPAYPGARFNFGQRSRRFVETAVAMTDVFVMQTSVSQLFGQRESLLRGLAADGAALFSVFSGSGGQSGDVPPYLVAAAAVESRVFPTVTFDPSVGKPGSVAIDGNPEKESDWPVHVFSYEDEKLQAMSEEIAFTTADFLAMDERFRPQFAVVEGGEPRNAMIPVQTALDADLTGLPDEVPYVTLIDADMRLRRAVLTRSIISETNRCRAMWNRLQDLGGLNDLVPEQAADDIDTQRPASEAAAAAPAATPSTAEPPTEIRAEVPDAATSNGDPYIETARCTTCNECTQVNPRMFQYDDNKQAYIADPDAGTFRQLVEAAEGCQVSIIHPGKPRNPKEPGLDDLIRRAEEFN